MKYNDINSLLHRKISSVHLRAVLGGSLHQGISNYLHEFSSEKDISPEEILIETLGSNLPYNKKFQKILILEILGQDQIQELVAFLKIKNRGSTVEREQLLTKSAKKIGQSIIKVLNLDPELYSVEDNDIDSIEEELVVTPDPNKYLSLHDYQKIIKDEINYNLFNPDNPRARMLVHMPTGSGKTKTSIEAITDFIRVKLPNEGLVVWFAHSNELCNQAYYSLIETWKLKGDYPLPVYRIFGNEDYDLSLLKTERAVIFIGFAKFNSLLNSHREEHVQLRSKISSLTKLAVIDEAHKTLAQTYKKAINYVSTNVDCRIMGLTATPGRSNDVNDPNNLVLADYFDNNIISIRDREGNRLANPLEHLQNQNVLAQIDHTTIEVKLDTLNPAELHRIISSGELDKSDINKLAESPYRNRIIIDQIEDALADERRNLVLVFACSTEHCVILKKLLEMRDIKSEVVLGSTPRIKRDKYIQDFKSGQLKVLINFGVLTTGFDAPKLKTLIVARHTNSLILYSQMIGRALRGPRNGGNEKNYVIDLIDNISQLGKADFMFSYWEDFWNKKLNKQIT